MAGVTDRAFRSVAKSEGAALVFTGLISADGLVRDSRKSHRMMAFLPEERPIGVQLFGSDPEIVAEAAREVEKLKPNLIDLNFGCPVRKVVKCGAGAALLKDPGRIRALVKAVVSAVSIPVSGKIRSGWDESHPVAVEVSRILEEEGACAVTVHARTKKMRFGGRADWSVIRKVKEAISLPVIGNGDVLSPEDGRRMLEETGCDLVMIGRGALGRPWIFRQMNHYLTTGEKLNDPSFGERIEVCLKHYTLSLRLLGKARGVKEMRKHIGWYLRGMPGSRQVRQEIFSITDPGKVESRLRHYADQLES